MVNDQRHVRDLVVTVQGGPVKQRLHGGFLLLGMLTLGLIHSLFYQFAKPPYIVCFIFGERG